MKLGQWTVDVSWTLVAWTLYIVLALSGPTARTFSTWLGFGISGYYVWQAKRIHADALARQARAMETLAEVEAIQKRMRVILNSRVDSMPATKH